MENKAVNNIIKIQTIKRMNKMESENKSIINPANHKIK